MKKCVLAAIVTGLVTVISARAIMERGDYPWSTKLRSFYDQEMTSEYPEIPWLLNLGPTGIRARIYPDKPTLLVVKYVFQDDRSPARGKLEIDDVIAGANGKRFKAPHRFGRRLPGGGGWDGPMMELAGHIEDSQGKDGSLKLIVWPGGDQGKQRIVDVTLKPVGRFAATFPYNCARSEKLAEELKGNIRRVNRFTGDPVTHPEPGKPYVTTKSGGHLAPVGMGAVAHLIGSDDNPSWQYLGRHAANTCALAPGNAFDGHAASNLHGFWSVLGAARSDQPETLRAYFDYMKTFIILSQTHNGGLILQPWGRDRPGCNSDTSYGPRILPTATGAALLSLPKKRLQITGAGM